MTVHLLIATLSIMKRAYGFTIVELLIVIVIIAILAALSYVGYQQVQLKARDSKRAQDVATITKALDLYYVDNGRYPVGSGSVNINSAWSASNEPTSWQNLRNQLAPYLPQLPVDPRNDGAGTYSVSDGYRYAYFSNTMAYVPNYCGASGVRQMYILGYKFESGEMKRTTAGECTVNQLITADSFHRSVK